MSPGPCHAPTCRHVCVRACPRDRPTPAPQALHRAPHQCPRYACRQSVWQGWQPGASGSLRSLQGRGAGAVGQDQGLQKLRCRLVVGAGPALGGQGPLEPISAHPLLARQSEPLVHPQPHPSGRPVLAGTGQGASQPTAWSRQKLPHLAWPPKAPAHCPRPMARNRVEGGEAGWLLCHSGAGRGKMGPACTPLGQLPPGPREGCWYRAGLCTTHTAVCCWALRRPLTWQLLHAVHGAEVILESAVAVDGHAQVELRHEGKEWARLVTVLNGAHTDTQQPVDVPHLLLWQTCRGCWAAHRRVQGQRLVGGQERPPRTVQLPPTHPEP